MRACSRLIALAALAALGLSACASAGRQAGGPAGIDLTPFPVVQEGQAASILQAIDATRIRGVDPKDNMAADPRIVGPFRQLSVASARISTQLKKNGRTPAAIKRISLLVPAQSSWPRFFVAVGDTRDESTYVLQVLASPNARSPYGLWAQPVLLPGATVPPIAAPGVGAQVIPPRSGGYRLSPQEVLTQYADYLTQSARSATAKNFRRSTFSDQLADTLAADRKKLTAVATVTSTHAVAGDRQFAIRTQDGGALVIGALIQDYTVTVKKGKGAVRVTDARLAALAGGKKSFQKSFTRMAMEVLVFRVPPAGSGSSITVIGAERGDIKASLS